MRTKLIICGRNDGLGARLKNFLITFRLAEKLNIHHFMYWVTISKHCSCNLELLFDDRKIAYINTKQKRYQENTKEIDEYVHKKWGIHIGKCGKVWDGHIVTKGMLDNFDTLLMCNSQFYQLEDEKVNFGDELRRIYRNFRLSKGVYEQLDKYDHIFKKYKIVGVHIRRGECVDKGGKKQRARGNVSVSSFYKILDEKYTDDEYKYFICSDDADVQKQFRKKYNHPRKNKVRHVLKAITYPERSLDRNNPVAIQDAFIVMNLLSKCHVIHGVHSAFNKMPAIFGGVKRYLVE